MSQACVGEAQVERVVFPHNTRRHMAVNIREFVLRRTPSTSWSLRERADFLGDRGQ